RNTPRELPQSIPRPDGDPVHLARGGTGDARGVRPGRAAGGDAAPRRATHVRAAPNRVRSRRAAERALPEPARDRARCPHRANAAAEVVRGRPWITPRGTNASDASGHA